MRYAMIAGLGLALLVGPAFAKDAKLPSCTAQWSAKSDSDKAATTRKAFMVGCKENNTAAPASAGPAMSAMSPKPAKTPSCTAQWNAKSDSDKAASTRKAFMAGCKEGNAVAPVSAGPAMSAMSPKPGKSPSCTAQWNGKSDADKAGTTRKAFMAGCKEGGVSPPIKPVAAPMAKPAGLPASAPVSPAKPTATPPSAIAPPRAAAPANTMKAAGAAPVAPNGPAPEGATGVCKDGTYTKSKTHSGSCSHHGGVAKWL